MAQADRGRRGTDSRGRLAVGELLAGRYRIVRPLGEGGMGQVYEAEDGEFGEHIALKIVHPQYAADERLIERLERWRTRLYRADDYAVYDVLLPVGQLYAGKDETHGIERDNARQRHWLARFRRRSIVVSKVQRMVDVSIALFARFAGNNRIADLISMLA